jgi:prepilin-type N-terminal cleavage/methylation domain-containing protein
VNLTRDSRKGGGFTLIELIMTMVVVGIASVPLALLIRQHIEAAQSCGQASSAMNLARLEIENVNAMDFAAIATASNLGFRGYPYDVVRTVAYVYGSDATPEGLKKVTVEVRAAGQKAPLIGLVTYVVRNVAYGQ